MAIDPSIILGIKQPQIQQTDPLEQAGGIMRLKALMGQGELQGLQTQLARRGLEDEEATRSAYRDAGGDATRLRVLLGERGLYKPLQALDKFELEKREKESSIGKNTAQAEKYSTDEKIARIERGASILSTARDQTSYDAARRAMALSFGAQAVAQMPDQYDPQFVQAKIAEGMTVAQRLADQRARDAQQITMRGQDMTSATAKRGQDITLRGQNLTDARARETLGAGRVPPGYRFTADGNLEAIPGGPADVKNVAEASKLNAAIGMYAAARDGLLSGLEGTETGPFVGRVPAVTTGQQIGEGSVAAMAPVLKQIFRVAGEGVFTDRDQQLLLDMVPKRTDTPEARAEKMANIDRIVSEKLGTPVPKRQLPEDKKAGSILTKNPDGSFTYGKPKLEKKGLTRNQNGGYDYAPTR